MKKYVFWYKESSVATTIVYNLYADSLKHLFNLIDNLGMEIPDCIEDCHSEIWWREDNC